MGCRLKKFGPKVEIQNFLVKAMIEMRSHKKMAQSQKGRRVQGKSLQYMGRGTKKVKEKSPMRRERAGKETFIAKDDLSITS